MVRTGDIMANFQIGEFIFPRKGEVAELLKAVLAALEPGKRIDDLFVSDLLTALAREHQDAAAKIGAGIEYWVVASNKDLGYASKGFRAKQIGRDELVLFSYTDVLNRPKQRTLVAEALTQEALDITRRFRTRAFASGPLNCALTGTLIRDKTMADAVHLDPPRGQLHQKFLASEGLTYETLDLMKHPTDSGYRLVDRDLAGRWRAFQVEHLGGMAIVQRRER